MSSFRLFLFYPLIVLSLVTGVAVNVQADGNPLKGAELFKQCSVCHAVGGDAQNGVGPALNHVFGRPAAADDAFNYSDAMKAKAGEGLVWDEKSLYTFLAGPQFFVKGTSMGFAGLRREKEIKDLMAWLIQFSPAYVPGSGQTPDDAAIAAATLPAISAESDEPEDPAFNETYLADAAAIATGGDLWAKQCRHCHGNSAYPGKAPKLKPASYTPEFTFDRITNGFKKMPAWKTVFTLEERKALTAYVLSNEFSP